MLTFADKVGRVKKDPKHADVKYGWSLGKRNNLSEVCAEAEECIKLAA